MRKTALPLPLILVLIVLVAYPDSAYAQITNEKLLSSIAERYKDAASGWAEYIQGRAGWLFWTLATLSFSWTIGTLMLQKADIQAFFAEFMRFMIFTGFFYWLLINGPDFADAIITSLQTIGSQAAGLSESPVEPSDILDIGFKLWTQIINASSKWSPVDSFVGFLVVGIITVILALVGVNMVLLMASGWIIAYAGIFILGFGGARWTSEMAIAYYKQILAIALQLMTMILIIGIGKTFLMDYAGKMSEGINFDEIMVILIIAVTLLVLCSKVPPMVAGLSGASTGGIGNIGAGQAMAAMAMAATGMAGAAKAMMAVAKGAGGAGAAVAEAFKKAAGGGAGGGGGEGNMAKGAGKEAANDAGSFSKAAGGGSEGSGSSASGSGASSGAGGGGESSSGGSGGGGSGGGESAGESSDAGGGGGESIGAGGGGKSGGESISAGGGGEGGGESIGVGGGSESSPGGEGAGAESGGDSSGGRVGNEGVAAGDGKGGGKLGRAAAAVGDLAAAGAKKLGHGAAVVGKGIGIAAKEAAAVGYQSARNSIKDGIADTAGGRLAAQIKHGDGNQSQIAPEKQDAAFAAAMQALAENKGVPADVRSKLSVADRAEINRFINRG